ncbi:MAG: N-acetyltransferase [Pseudomonadales bacterium]
MTEITIRHATPSDLDTLAAFNIAMAAETEDRHLPPDIIKKGVAQLVNERDKGFYLVAESDDCISGCLAITFEWSDWRCGLFWWIQSVYVDKAFRRTGVFRALYDHVTDMARTSGDVCGIRLYVERDNVRAQHTYRQLGMIETDYKLFEVEFEPNGS